MYPVYDEHMKRIIILGFFKRIIDKYLNEKIEIFNKEFSRIVQEAFEVRQESDYEDFYVISKEETIAQYENAKKFVTAVAEYIKSLKQ